MKKVFLIAIILAVVAGGAYLVFGYGKKDNTAAAVTSKPVLPIRGELKVSITSTGKVEPVKTVDVKSKASGEITKLFYEAGEYVNAGDLLATIDKEQVQYSYDKAVADLEVAKVSLETNEREFNRQKELFDKGMISEADIDAAKMSLEQARATLVRTKAAASDAKKQLDDTVIRAPISGLIIARNVEEGNIIASGISNVSGGTLLMQIAQVDSVFIVASVDETDIGKVELGQKVEVEADAYPDKKFHGEVLKIAPMAQVQQNVTVFEVTTKVDNAERKLKTGMNASIEIITAFAENALLVPNAAVKDPKKMPGAGGEVMAGGGQGQRPQGQQAPTAGANPQTAARFGNRFQEGERAGKDTKLVFVVTNGQVTPKRVVVGAANLDYTQILEGLAESDSVDVTPFSQMMQDRQAWRERMASRMGGMPGMPGGGRR